MNRAPACERTLAGPVLQHYVHALREREQVRRRLRRASAAERPFWDARLVDAQAACDAARDAARRIP